MLGDWEKPVSGSTNRAAIPPPITSRTRHWYAFRDRVCRFTAALLLIRGEKRRALRGSLDQSTELTKNRPAQILHLSRIPCYCRNYQSAAPAASEIRKKSGSGAKFRLLSPHRCSQVACRRRARDAPADPRRSNLKEKAPAPRPGAGTAPQLATVGTPIKDAPGYQVLRG